MTERQLELAIAIAGIAAADAASEARDAGAQLLILPRCPTRTAEVSDGPLADAMGDLAATRGLALLFGYAEACSGHRHLGLQLVLADGRSTANYRATHLTPAAIAAGWSPGNWLTMARLEPLTLGLLGGIDHLAPEVGRALSGLGAEALIAVLDPADTLASRPPVDLLAPLARLRAIENDVPVCLIEASGTVHAADARGQPIMVDTRARIARLTLSVGAAARLVPRRPDLYGQLVAASGG